MKRILARQGRSLCVGAAFIVAIVALGAYSVGTPLTENGSRNHRIAQQFAARVEAVLNASEELRDARLRMEDCTEELAALLAADIVLQQAEADYEAAEQALEDCLEGEDPVEGPDPPAPPLAIGEDEVSVLARH